MRVVIDRTEVKRPYSYHWKKKNNYAPVVVFFLNV
jgi:hypothetical protein